MTRYTSQVAYGILLLITGALIAYLSSDPSRTIQLVVAVGMLLSAVFAFITAAKSKNAPFRIKYHELQGVGMLLFGVALLAYGSTFERFITVTTAFLLFFGITEILFGFQLMSYKQKISMPLIGSRMVTGFLMAAGAVLILAIAFMDKNVSLLIAGILIALSGLNFILFANALKRLAFNG